MAETSGSALARPFLGGSDRWQKGRGFWYVYGMENTPRASRRGIITHDVLVSSGLVAPWTIADVDLNVEKVPVTGMTDIKGLPTTTRDTGDPGVGPCSYW